MSSMEYTVTMAEKQCLIPGFLTHVELDPLVGSSRTRQRWEDKGLLPKGRWIKGFGRRLGLYPEIVLARVVAGPSGGGAERGLDYLNERASRLLESELFEEITAAVSDVFRDLEHLGLRTELLECLAERRLLEPLQKETYLIAGDVIDAGISFSGMIGKVVGEAGGMIVVESHDEQLKLAAESALGLIHSGLTVAVERVRVGAKEHDFVMPAGPIHHDEAVPDSYAEDALWEEMFASYTGRPVMIPVLADNAEASGTGGDLVRPQRRIRIRIPSEIYAGANPMVRTRLETAHA
jgi:hypothetical protein